MFLTKFQTFLLFNIWENYLDSSSDSVSGYPEHAFIDNGVCHPSNSDADTTMNSIMHQLVKNKDIKKVKKIKTKAKKGGRRTRRRNRKN